MAARCRWGALGNSYGPVVFMLRQACPEQRRRAQHERFLPVVLSPAPFALSLSKPVLSLPKGVNGGVFSDLCPDRKNRRMHPSCLYNSSSV